VHYIVGNHDYLINRISKEANDYPFSVKKSLRLVDSGSKYYFTHGYEIDVMTNMEHMMTVNQYEQLSEKLCFLTDKTGWLASTIWKATEILDQMKEQVKKVQSPPSERGEEMDSIRIFGHSAARNLLLGLKPDESLVFGHTHIPYVEELKSGIWVGNTGAWGQDVIDPATGKQSSNSYMKIYDGKMELHFFKSSKTSKI
jgi:UDP-2,3-diacylglucosamine pyrophosphatase LpxH